MARMIALATATVTPARFESVRTAVVCGFALVLIVADRALPSFSL